MLSVFMSATLRLVIATLTPPRESDKWLWRGGITEPMCQKDSVLEFLTELAFIDISVEREVIWVL